MPYPEWLQKYLDRGFRLVFWPRGKDPTTWKGPRDPGWPTKHYNPEDYTPDCNVGVMLGTEIQPGRFLVDIDFDWTDGVSLTKGILPPTEFGFGRSSRQLSHAFYTTPEPIASKMFKDVDGTVLVEIRSTKADEEIGRQTMVPPSLHPTGETITMRLDGEIGHSEILPHRCVLYAIACLFYKHFRAGKGFKHDVRLAVCGFLLGDCGMSEEDVIRIGSAVAQLTGNDPKDFALCVQTTAEYVRSGKHYAGRAALIQELGGDKKDKEGKRIVSLIREWLGSSEFLHDEKDKIYKDSQENIKRAINKLAIDLSFNAFSQTPMIKYNGFEGRLEDHMENQVWLDIDTKFQFRPQREFFKVVIESVGRHNTVHPVKDYLSLLKWDGTPRLDTWLIQYAAAADSEYVRAISSMVLIAAVRRVREPGCKFDEMLVLESGQGLNKSTALRVLCKNDHWFSDDLPLNADSKVIIERTAGKWIIEAADLSGMRDQQIEQLKAMLSRQVDASRLAYGHLMTEVPRQWIVIGTTNAHVYLKDTTGNRRFWPMQVQQFHFEGLREVRDQLWAEAAQREAAGESIRLSPHLYSYAEMQQERRRETDPWEAVLVAHTKDKEKATREELWSAVRVPVERQDSAGQKRISEIMNHIGFKNVAIWIDGQTIRGWKRVKPQYNLLEPKEDS